MHGDFAKELHKVHFLTEIWNMRILRVLLEQTEGISISDVAKRLKINKGMAKYRLELFAQMYFCDVGIDIPKYEEMRKTKSYKLMYILKPKMRSRLNKFIDIVDSICQPRITTKLATRCDEK